MAYRFDRWASTHSQSATSLANSPNASLHISRTHLPLSFLAPPLPRCCQPAASLHHYPPVPGTRVPALSQKGMVWEHSWTSRHALCYHLFLRVSLGRVRSSAITTHLQANGCLEYSAAESWLTPTDFHSCSSAPRVLVVLIILFSSESQAI